MIRSGFLSAQDRKELLGCVKSQTEEHGIARRANALLLLDEGKPCTAIAKVLYIDDDTVRCWHKQYVRLGFCGYQRLAGWHVSYDGGARGRPDRVA